MKQIFLLISLLLFFVSNGYAESPTDKGVYSLGGSVTYADIESDSGSGYDMFVFNPYLLYFIYDDIAIGSVLEYSKTSQEIGDSVSYGVGPIFRYYLPDTKINPFLQLVYQYSKTESSYSSYTAKTTDNQFSFGLGFDYFISKNVAIEPIIQYSWNNRKYDSTYPYISLSRDEDQEMLTIGLGIFIYIF